MLAGILKVADSMSCRRWGQPPDSEVDLHSGVGNIVFGLALRSEVGDNVAAGSRSRPREDSAHLRQ